jgi:hypothetical protein
LELLDLIRRQRHAHDLVEAPGARLEVALDVLAVGVEVAGVDRDLRLALAGDSFVSS